MNKVKREFNQVGRRSGEGSQNVDDHVDENVETPLLPKDTSDRNRSWHHDNPWIRIPVQALLALLIFITRPQFIFVVILIAGGVWLTISISHGELPLGLFMAEAFTAIAWAIYTRIANDRDSPEASSV